MIRPIYPFVMAGLVPAIHVGAAGKPPEASLRAAATWMPATSAGMTKGWTE